jgi:hypothetical protein
MAHLWNVDTKMWLPAQMKEFVTGLPTLMTHAHALVRRAPTLMLLSTAMEGSPLEGWYLTQGATIDISLCGGTIDRLAADLFDSGKVELISLTIRYGSDSVTLQVPQREIQVVGDIKLPPLPDGMKVAKITLLERPGA